MIASQLPVLARPHPGPGQAAHPPGRLRLGPAVAIVVVLLALCAASLVFGARQVGWADLLAGLAGQSDNLGQSAVAKRIIRTVLALLTGAALGLSGAVMQGVTRNPLADPGILGVNLGASLAVAACVAAFGVGNATVLIWVAILGAALAAGFVFAVGSIGRGGPTPLSLALAGAATSAAAASLISAIALSRPDIATNLQAWQIGGVGGGQWNSVLQIAPFIVVGSALCLVTARSLNALALGEDLAAGLGQRVMLARVVAGLGAAMLCGAATAVAGPIGFVGLVVPHLCRLLLGIDYRWLLPCSALGGAALLIAADIVGRLVARPNEIPAGIVTALIGAPFFIAIVRRRRVKLL